MSEVTWKDIEGTDGKYEVSTDGRVRRKAYELKPYALREGHLYVTLNGGRRVLVHRLVAEAFMANPEKKRCVNHKNGQPGDNNLSNLEWATHGENNLHAYRQNGKIHYSNIAVIGVNPADGEVVHQFPSGYAAARHLGVTGAAIHAALRNGGKCRGFYWKRA